MNSLQNASPFSRRVGGHVSIAGGYANSLTKAENIGANALQIFSGSPRVWKRPEMNLITLKEYAQAADERDLRPIFVHALYLINLCSENTESVQKSKEVLIYELKFCEEIGATGLVVHLGSLQGREWQTHRDALAITIREIIDAAKSPTPFLIENTASKNKVTADLAQIRWLIDAVDRKNLGWCYDTCHGWAAGYSPTQPLSEEFDLFAKMEELDLWDSLKCIHLNDSRDTQGSGRDRHANILDGNIPKADLEAIINHLRLKDLPLITEAPGLDGNGPDVENIKRIRSLIA